MANNLLGIGTISTISSIINPDVDVSSAADNFQPFSFFEYLKNTRQFNTPEQFTQGYNDYLHQWYALKNAQPQSQRDEIKQRYIDLLKDIAVNYTTSEEKRFLSNIDYNDPSDLAVAVPFYAQKLKEICLFYKYKRDKFKYRINELKIKGTPLSIEKAIFQSVVDYASTATDIAAATVQSIATNLQISITEYVDEYSNYFDLDPDASASDLQVTNDLRTKYITSNTNTISANLFLNLNDSIINEVLNTPIYLKEIGTGLLINPMKVVQQALAQANCAQTLAQFIGASVNTLSANYELQKQLIEKYIGTDFFYLSTNSQSTFVSGALFKAANPSANLVNKRFVTTASVPEDQLISLQQLGLFFKPDKMGVIQFASPSKQWAVNAANLEADKIYVFPNPDCYGNVDNFAYSNLSTPFIYAVDNTVLIKGIDQGAAVGYIKSSEYLQNYYAYFSEPVYLNDANINISSFDAKFLRIFNQGSFTSYAQDIHGNEYGVVKPVKRFNADQNNDEAALGQCITIDGHTFYDDYEGFSFNFATTGNNFDGSIRTGLTAQTANNFPPFGGSFTTGYDGASAGMFTLSGDFYTVYFREYSPYIDCNTFDNLIGSVRDGGAFAASDTELLPDVSSDSPAWNIHSKVYYDTLCDAGLSATNSTQPGLTSCAMSAVPALSSSNFEMFDGRLFPNQFTIEPDYNYSGYTANYVDLVNPGCVSILQTSQLSGAETLNDVNELAGTLLVKNIVTNQVSVLSASLSATFSKYSDAVKSDIYGSNVEAVNIYYDTIVVTTSSFMVFDKIVIDNAGQFVKPGTNNNYLSVSASDFCSSSNQFFIEKTNDVWLYKTTVQSDTSASNAKVIYPEIYRYSIKTNKLQKIFPNIFTTAAQISSLFVNPLSAVNFVRISDAKLTYASFNDKFNASWVLHDLNGLSYICSAPFDYVNDSIEFDPNQIALYTPSTFVETFNFNTPLSAINNDLEVSAFNGPEFNSANNILFFN